MLFLNFRVLINNLKYYKMNRKTMIGIAAGAAVLAGAAYYIMRKRANHANGHNEIDEAKKNFKSKLNELQRKAGKELKNVGNDAGEAVNSAKDRANDWVNNSAQA